MTEELRAAIIGCGRMGGTIDDEVRGSSTKLALGVVESHRQGGAGVPCPVANCALYMASR